VRLLIIPMDEENKCHGCIRQYITRKERNKKKEE
jgi:hypothetical protein